MDERKELFDAYVAQYNNVLSRMGYPAKNSTGFTERNLSVNFSKVYEKKNPEAVSWFEFQSGENRIRLRFQEHGRTAEPSVQVEEVRI